MKEVNLVIKRGSGNNYTYKTYKVPVTHGMTVLEALIYVKEHFDLTLNFRYSCRMEICGSCAVMINNQAKTACSTQIEKLKKDTIKIEPLNGFPWIKDLVVEFQQFYDKHESVMPTLIRTDPVEGQILQTPKQLAKYRQFTLCIKCGACVAACPISNSDPLYLGPAALTAAYRFNVDSRDQGKDQRLLLADGAEGCWRCHFSAECSEVCPKSVDPAYAIQKLKVQSLMFELKRLVTFKRKGEKK